MSRVGIRSIHAKSPPSTLADADLCRELGDLLFGLLRLRRRGVVPINESVVSHHSGLACPAIHTHTLRRMPFITFLQPVMKQTLGNDDAASWYLSLSF